MKNKQGFSAIALIIILALLVLGGGYAVWKNKAETPTPVDTNPPNRRAGIEPPTPPIPSTLPSTPSVDMVDWKTYRNEEYGFEFKYPATWNLRENNGGRQNDEGGVNLSLMNDSISAVSFSSRKSTKDDDAQQFIGDSPIKTADGLLVKQILIPDTPCPAYDYISSNSNLNRLFFFKYTRAEQSDEFLATCIKFRDRQTSGIAKTGEHLDSRDTKDQEIMGRILSSLKTI